MMYLKQNTKYLLAILEKENKNNNVSNTITLKIGYKEPFRYESLLEFLKTCSIFKVEKGDNVKLIKMS